MSTKSNEVVTCNICGQVEKDCVGHTGVNPRNWSLSPEYRAYEKYRINQNRIRAGLKPLAQ